MTKKGNSRGIGGSEHPNTQVSPAEHDPESFWGLLWRMFKSLRPWAKAVVVVLLLVAICAAGVVAGIVRLGLEDELSDRIKKEPAQTNNAGQPKDEARKPEPVPPPVTPQKQPDRLSPAPQTNPPPTPSASERSEPSPPQRGEPRLDPAVLTAKTPAPSEAQPTSGRPAPSGSDAANGPLADRPPVQAALRTASALHASYKELIAEIKFQRPHIEALCAKQKSEARAQALADMLGKPPLSAAKWNFHRELETRLLPDAMTAEQALHRAAASYYASLMCLAGKGDTDCQDKSSTGVERRAFIVCSERNITRILDSSITELERLPEN